MLYVKYKCRDCGAEFKEAYYPDGDETALYPHTVARKLMATNPFETHECERDVAGVADVVSVTEEPYNEN